MKTKAMIRSFGGAAMFGAVIACATAAQAQEDEKGKAKALPRLEVQWEGIDIRLTAGAAAQGAVFSDDDPLTDSPDAKVDLFARLNAQ